MKKATIILMLLVLSSVVHAQKEITKFLGIPIDGTRSEMVQKLEAKGFIYHPEYSTLKGEFNGRNVILYITTNKEKVWRIMVLDETPLQENDVKKLFNTLCRQFENNAKYTTTAEVNQTIPEEENIFYEMLVNEKRYQAFFYQEPFTNDLERRSVWFRINEISGSYHISLYYDNEYNMANGEDL